MDKLRTIVAGITVAAVLAIGFGIGHAEAHHYGGPGFGGHYRGGDFSSIRGSRPFRPPGGYHRPISLTASQ